MAADPIALPIADDVPRTLEQVAEALGAPYNVNTLRAAADRGDLVTYPVVGTALFSDRRYVKEWIERCRARASGAGSPGQPERAETSPPASPAIPGTRTAAAAAADEIASRLTGGSARKKPAFRPNSRSISQGF